MLPSFNDLRYFVEIAGARNLSRAAERLGVSQPSLSLAVSRLEDSVGAALLIRSKRGVELTQAGRVLLTRSKKFLESWEQVRNRASQSTNEVIGNYVLGAHASIAIYLFEKVLPRLLHEYSNLNFRLEHNLSRKILEGVISMRIDIGVVVNPVRHPDLIIKKLFQDEVRLWEAKNNKNKNVLICDQELTQTQDILRKIKKKGADFGRVLDCPSLEVVTSLVSSGAGVGIIPSRVANHGGLGKLKKISGSPVYRDEICVAYRVENRSNEAIKKIALMMQEA